MRIALKLCSIMLVTWTATANRLALAGGLEVVATHAGTAFSETLRDFLPLIKFPMRKSPWIGPHMGPTDNARRMKSYGELATSFENSTVPSKQDVTGWWAGRTFCKAHPTKELPWMLVGQEYKKAKTVFKLMPLDYVPSEPADIFEHLTPELIKEVKKVWLDSNNLFSEPEFGSRGISFHTFEDDVYNDYEVREHGKLLIFHALGGYRDIKGEKRPPLFDCFAYGYKNVTPPDPGAASISVRGLDSPLEIRVLQMPYSYKQ